MKRLMNYVMVVTLFTFALGITSCKSKPKDADIKAAVETALKADPMAMGAMVDVKDGIATISGECKDDMCKSHCAELVAGIKGVKSVVNNCTVAPPPPPVINSDDTVLSSGLIDALKDMPNVKGSIAEGKIVLTGEIAKAKWAMLKQTLDKMKPKGYDLSGLTIK